MDWQQHFKKIRRGSTMAGETESTMGVDAQPVKPRQWFHVQHWGIGEWGSLASILGLGLWVAEKIKKL